MFRKSIANLGSQVLNFAISCGDRIILVAILIRTWGAHAYSDWTTLLAASALFSLAEIGFQIQYGNRLAAAHARSDLAAFLSTLSIGIIFYASMAISLLAGLAAFVSFADFGSVFRLTAFDRLEASVVFQYLGASSILRIARASLSQLYRGRGEFHRGILVDAVVNALTIGTAIAAVSAGAAPKQLAFIYLGAELLFGWGGMLTDIIRRYGKFFRLRLPPRAEVVTVARTLSLYGLVQGLPTVALSGPILVMSALSLGGSGLVSYVVQRSLFNFGKSLSTMVTVAVGVELADLAHRGAQRDLQTGIRILARLSASLAGLLAAGLLCFGPTFVGIWTGDPTLVSIPMMVALLVPAVATAAATPLTMVSMYADRPHAAAAGLSVQIAIGIPAAVLGGLLFQVTGVAFGVAIGEVVGNGFVSARLAARTFGMTYSSLLRDSSVASAVAIGWAGIAGGLISEIIEPDGLASIGVAIILWIGLGAVPPFILLLPIELRRKAAQILGRILE
jgi:O-antigen/teichoic acid export membrane protein